MSSAKNFYILYFYILAISLDVLHNYFDSLNYFSDLYLTKILAKSLFPCKKYCKFVFFVRREQIKIKYIYSKNV